VCVCVCMLDGTQRLKCMCFINKVHVMSVCLHIDYSKPNAYVYKY